MRSRSAPRPDRRAAPTPWLPTTPRACGRAEAAVRQALVDQGIEGVPIDVTVTCTPYPRQCHSGTSVITVHVASRVDLPLMPDVLGGGAPSFALDATHKVPIGQFHEVAGG